METSVHCKGNERSERFCHFENLCYHNEHKDFIFFMANASMIENVPSDSQNILDLSSVADHTLHFFSFLYLPSETMTDFTVKWINRRSLIFNRFKPDNIMHILHDDILPLHHTLKQIKGNFKLNRNTQEKFDIQILTFEDWPDDIEYQFLYDLFSRHDMLTVNSLKKMGELVCFSDVYVGISKETTWYQYGFYVPQGPVPNSKVTSSQIQDTVNYVLSHIDTECTLCNLGPYLVLLSRKETRRILNEMDLSISIAQHIGMKVLSVSLETHSLVDIINLIRNSKGLIGMHGSLLALAIFLQPGSILIELFPFAINPAHYTPYKTLSGIPSMNIYYANWVNTNEENTVMHPDWPPELGGISDLKDQQEIMNQKEVPKHLCCDDPSWLFHIYQDTIVDINTIIQLVKTMLTASINENTSEKARNIVAGPVRDLNCVTEKNSIRVKWKAPWSLRYIPHKTVQYQLFIFNTQLNSTTSFLITNTIYTYNKTEATYSFLVWVQCQLDNLKGYLSNLVKC
ncbi:hypothetical protein LOTGIDRAFT_194055 [Lottia gigantea]|uniref:Glycosyltransferase 61 catalytic domain-containing protein n=1 Tax=Lottia gigantea TaxID=225164 RepID=V3ZZ57_LOTGI|nr:hypothetical protein LOTGIDRAFT_194055 [Lottia gigantea]ESO87915.1 hypothetical protein LOTGIDRAFT_194055 [Lottia gigantea]